MTQTQNRRPRRDARAGIVLRSEQLERWRRIAFERDMTLSRLIRRAVDEHVAQLEAEGA